MANIQIANAEKDQSLVNYPGVNDNKKRQIWSDKQDESKVSEETQGSLRTFE